MTKFYGILAYVCGSVALALLAIMIIASGGQNAWATDCNCGTQPPGNTIGTPWYYCMMTCGGGGGQPPPPPACPAPRSNLCPGFNNVPRGCIAGSCVGDNLNICPCQFSSVDGGCSCP